MAPEVDVSLVAAVLDDLDWQLSECERGLHAILEAAPSRRTVAATNCVKLQDWIDKRRRRSR